VGWSAGTLIVVWLESAPVPFIGSAVIGGALSLEIESVPGNPPAAVGVNVTWIEQLALAGSVPGQLFVCAKGAVILIWEMFNDTFPVLLSVIACAALVVPTNCVPKERLEDERLATAAPPVPVKFTLKTFGAVVLIENDPLYAIASVGLNRTATVQLVPAGITLPGATIE
jgi:hypothetical protein